MAVVWRNNGEKTENGEYVVDLTREDGTPYQTFKANTRKDIAEKIAASADEGSRMIERMKEQRIPIARTAERKVDPLSADERFAAANDITDPEMIDSVVERVISAKFGMPLEDVAKVVSDEAERKKGEKARQETIAFVNSTPDWWPTEKNKIDLFNLVEQRGWAPIANNFGIVWEEMKANGTAELKPAEGDRMEEESEREPQLQPGQPRPRLARTISTGIRNEDTSSRLPGTPRPKYTKDDIANMGQTLYRQKYLNEQGFRELVDSMGTTA